MLDVLLALKIKDVNLDEEKEQELKQKKLMSHKQKLLQLSKKERKVTLKYNNEHINNIKLNFPAQEETRRGGKGVIRNKS